MEQQFSLRWNNYLNQITDAFGSLRNEEDLVDVTLSCEGRKIKAHRMLLSACSSYFRDIFKDNPCQHPVIVFRNVKFEDIQAIIDFMYQGEVNILQDQLESFLSTAEMMEVKGLTNESSGRDDDNQEKYKAQEMSENESPVSYTPTSLRPGSPPTKKRKHPSTLNKPQQSRPKAPPVKEVSTTYVPVIVKEEVIEDLTIEDDDDDDPPILDRVKTEHGFDTGSVQDSLNSSMAPIDQMLAIEPGPSLEGVGQDMSDENVDYAVEGKGGNKTGTEIDEKKLLKKEATSKLLSTEHTKYQVESSTIYSKGKKTLTLQKELTTPKTTVNKASHPVQVTKQSFSENLNVNKITSGSAPSVQKSGLNLPKGITVDVCSFNLNQPELDGDQNLNDLSSFGSVEAQTPVHEVDCQYLKSGVSDCPALSHIMLDEPDKGQTEASNVVTEPKPELETGPEEPEFDYFGCETCKADRKPVDKLKIILSHKCPICPCACYCAHLLKEHMKVIHGWFNVQRKFTTY